MIVRTKIADWSDSRQKTLSKEQVPREGALDWTVFAAAA